MAFDPYKKRTEPNMRQEMINTLDGTFPEIAKGMKILLRRMQRDSNGDLVKCACWDEVTREPDKDSFCPLCYGEGNYWDEVWLEVYRSSAIESSGAQAQAEDLYANGLHNIPLMVFYTRSSEVITEDDKIVELILDNEGEIIYPAKRRRIFRIVRAVDYRLENGRLEYWKISSFEEKVRYLNGVNG